MEKNTIGFYPYELLYGKSVTFPIEFDIKKLRTTLQVNLDLIEEQKHHLEQLNELDEIHLETLCHISVVQQQHTKWHDRFIKNRLFQKGDWELLYDSRFKDFKEKIYTRWLGPYEVDTIFDNGTIKLTTIDELQTPLFANGNHLWMYHKPLFKDSFVSNIVSNP